MNKAVITLPLSPVKWYDFGRMVTPVVAETIAKIGGAKFYLSINLLDSYNNRMDYYHHYIDVMNKTQIGYDCLWNDSENIQKLIEQISRLINLGYIYTKRVQIVRCECGIVEIEKKNFATINPNNTSYHIENGQMYCNYCHGLCKEYSEDHLIFDPSRVKNKGYNFFPTYLNKDIKTFEKTVLDNYSVISRKRNTGIVYFHDGNYYNIDIDFLWGTYLTLFQEEQKIVVCGNHELYQLFVVGTIEKCLNPEADTMFIGTPFVNGMKELSLPCESVEDVITRKLLILFNIKWNKKEKDFDKTILSYLSKISFSKKKRLYSILCQTVGNNHVPFSEIIEKELPERINMQKCLAKEKGK